MSTYINRIETAVPEFSYKQDEVREIMKQLIPGDERRKRLVHQLFSRSGIKTRHSVIRDFHQPDESGTLFFNGQGLAPGTKSRNETYIREARKLYVDVAEQLLSGSRFTPEDITHVITISCTGFYAPGPDYDIIKSLGLNHSIERYHLGFMGCYAAISALKMAHQICKANSAAAVLVISVELCTLHFQADSKMDNLLSTSVFSDGGAGAIVSNHKPETGGFRIDGFASSITEKGAGDMAWSVGDHGFEMVLSSYIPELLQDELQPFLIPVLEQFGLGLDEIERWAVHPGGRAILDKVEKTLNLDKSLLMASRKVLSEFGNMSSATVLFVMKELLSDTPDHDKRTLAMAFGPGLTLESALLTQVSAKSVG